MPNYPASEKAAFKQTPIRLEGLAWITGAAGLIPISAAVAHRTYAVRFIIERLPDWGRWPLLDIGFPPEAPWRRPACSLGVLVYVLGCPWFRPSGGRIFGKYRNLHMVLTCPPAEIARTSANGPSAIQAAGFTMGSYKWAHLTKAPSIATRRILAIRAFPGEWNPPR